jgi:hypothetical protein
MMRTKDQKLTGCEGLLLSSVYIVSSFKCTPFWNELSVSSKYLQIWMKWKNSKSINHIQPHTEPLFRTYEKQSNEQTYVYIYINNRTHCLNGYHLRLHIWWTLPRYIIKVVIFKTNNNKTIWWRKTQNCLPFIIIIICI